MTTIEQRLATLQQELATRKEDSDLPGNLSPRERMAYHARTADLNARISAIRVAAERLAALTASLGADIKWLNHLEQWRVQLCSELKTIQTKPAPAKEKKDAADDIIFSMRVLDFGFRNSLPIVTLAPTRLGGLMADAGYATEGEALRGPNGWRGNLEDTERRVKSLRLQHAEAQVALEKALLTDEERVERDAETVALRDAFNGMNVTLGADGRTLTAFTPDGDELEIEDMTEMQRRAFERMAAAQQV
jgi:hypothetical protein